MTSSRVWDVTIVGAGPAGATAAIHLARRGLRTLLIDKYSFPRDKVCGDALIADSIRSLKRVDLYEEVRSQGYRTTVGTVYSPSRISFDVSGEFITLKRFKLDDLIVKKAVASGAVFQQGKVTDLRIQSGNEVHSLVAGGGGPIRSRVVLLATGANINLGLKLGIIKNQAASAIALRCYVNSSFPLDRLVISYDRSIIPGYAWIFPLGNGEFNLGCGVFYQGQKNSNTDLRRLFDKFLADFPLASGLIEQATHKTEIRGAMLRSGLRGTKAEGSGNILAIGEAVGCTFPFTGEGIGKAMETGEHAAEIVCEALDKGDFRVLREYSNVLDRQLRPKYLGYEIAEVWLSKLWLNDLLARRIRRSAFLRDAIAGILNETTDPRKVFSLLGLLKSFVS